ncbi:MAG: hypothetical protein K5657_03560 [Desulfovibrio sp.]|nr:hypothetical protein [Desulfovibrio sp.]
MLSTSSPTLPTDSPSLQNRAFLEVNRRIRGLMEKGSFFVAQKEAVPAIGRFFAEKDADALLMLGETLQKGGFLSDAEDCFLKAMDCCEGDGQLTVLHKQAALFSLGTLAAEAAAHDITNEIEKRLLRLFPAHREVLLSLLFHMSYCPHKNVRKQRSLAEFWARSQPRSQREPLTPSPCLGRKLRIGYVSPDFKVHPVGFFIRGILQAHDSERFEIYAYNTAKDDDNPIASIIKRRSVYRTVYEESDDAFEDIIRRDRIDCLVDLAGFTRGTRLSVFARKPAPCQLSWLGYWGTTGLPEMDAVLLDEWHAPPGMEKYFVEPIYRLPVPRFCYQPLAEGPDVSENPPCVRNGYVTFASMNNLMKLNGPLLDTWAEILRAIPSSRLLLKWRAFHDPACTERIIRAFERRHVERERLLLHGWSSISDMLKEYSDVDIALDPFPFTGSITSCNALWMGVPVVTLAGESVIARQGHAIVSALHLEELSANSVEHYINIALGLARNTPLLLGLRRALRSRMTASPLLDVAGFTRELETAFLTIYQRCIPHSSKHLIASADSSTTEV